MTDDDHIRADIARMEAELRDSGPGPGWKTPKPTWRQRLALRTRLSARLFQAARWLDYQYIESQVNPYADEW